MQLPKRLTEIVSEIAEAAEGAAGPDEIDRRLAQAAAAVEEFAGATALPALEAALLAASSGDPRPGEGLRRLADDAVQQTAVLAEETARFLDHFDTIRKS